MSITGTFIRKLTQNYLLIMPTILYAATPFWVLPLQDCLCHNSIVKLKWILLMIAIGMVAMHFLYRKKGLYKIGYKKHMLVITLIVSLLLALIPTNIRSLESNQALYFFYRVMFTTISIYSFYLASSHDKRRYKTVNARIKNKIKKRCYHWITQDEKYWKSRQTIGSIWLRIGGLIIIPDTLFLSGDMMVSCGMLGIIAILCGDVFYGKWILIEDVNNLPYIM